MLKINYKFFIQLTLLLFTTVLFYHWTHLNAYGMLPLEKIGEKRKTEELLSAHSAKKPSIHPEATHDAPPLILKMLQDTISLITPPENYIKDQILLINTTDQNGNTPLHWISKSPQGNDMHALAKELIQLGAHFQANNKNNDTPLYLAIHCGHHNITRELIQAGAIVDTQNNKTFNPLLLAILDGETENIQSLIEDYLEKIQSYPKNQPSPLRMAILAGNLDIIKILIQSDINLEIQAYEGKKPSIFHIAARKGHLEIVNALIQAGVNLELKDSKGHTPLHIAVGFDKIDVVKALIRAGANLNTKENQRGNTPLHVATLYERITIINELLQAGANLNENNNQGATPLALALTDEKLKTIQSFATQCVDEIQAHHGLKPSLLHIAAKKGYLEIIHTLIQAGANLEAEDAAGLTPIHYAAHAGTTDVIKALIQANANLLESKNKNHWTPLRIAAIYGRKQAVLELIQMGADLSAPTPHTAMTILHHTILKEQQDIAELLLHYDTKNLKNTLSEEFTPTGTQLIYSAGSNALDIAKLFPEKFKRFIEISEALIAFQEQNIEQLVDHVEAQKEIDLQLLENDLLQTPFDRGNLENFSKKLKIFLLNHDAINNKNKLKSKLNLPLDKNKSETSREKISCILNIVSQRLVGKLEDLCLRKLQLCFKNAGKYHTHPYAQESNITQDNSFEDSQTEDNIIHSLNQNEEKLDLIFKTNTPSADKLFSRSSKEFLIKAIHLKP